MTHSNESLPLPAPAESAGTPQTPDLTRDPAVGALINNPMKIVALGALAKNEGAATSTGVVNTINSMLIPASSQKLPKSANNMVNSHCDALVAGGLATKTEHNGKKVFQITEHGKSVGVRVAGAAGGWLLDNQNLPTQQVFGATVRAGEDSPNNSAQIRFNVIEAVADNPNVTMQAIADAIGEKSLDRVTQAARNLVEDGILLNSRPAARGETIKINPAIVKKYEQTGRAETPQLLATYQAAEQLAGKGAEVTKDQLLDKVSELYPELDRQEVWDQILKSTSQGRLSYLQLSRPGLQFNPRHETAIRNLVKSVRNAVNGSVNETGRAERQGQNILNDPAYVDVLIAAGRGRSGAGRASRTPARGSRERSSGGGSTVRGIGSVSIARVIADMHPALAKLDGVEAGDSVLLKLREARGPLEESIDFLSAAISSARNVPSPADYSPKEVEEDYKKAQAVLKELNLLLAKFVSYRQDIESYIHEMNRELPGTLPNRVRTILENL